MNTLPPRALMERVVSKRDRDFDGVFIVAVRTTGIFCKPSCPARALPKNREFYPTASDAIRAGFRPCLRCKPLLAGGAVPEWMARLVARIDSEPSRCWPDKELRAIGVDPIMARRYFLQHFGMTFQAFVRGRRLGEALRELKRGTTLDTSALDHGYESLSGFRDAFGKVFGESTRQAKSALVVVSWRESPIGPLLLAASDSGLCALEFVGNTNLEGQMDALRKTLGAPVVPGTNKYIEQTQRELIEYFAGKRREFDVKLAPTGTPFQRAVWNQLLRIPYGETSSYQDLARATKKSPTACRAVGQANGRNRIVILIPCHRVINKDGSLGGYGGELWRKRYLLELEQRVLRSTEDL